MDFQIKPQWWPADELPTVVTLTLYTTDTSADENMAGSNKVLVLGGTGPAGICLLREVLHRQHPTVAFARNTFKIPDDLSSNPLLEVSCPSRR